MKLLTTLLRDPTPEETGSLSEWIIDEGRGIELSWEAIDEDIE